MFTLGQCGRFIVGHLARLFFLSLVCVGSPLYASAASLHANKSLLMERLGDEDPKPVIDGQLDDDVWKGLSPRSDFHQIKPTEYGNPTERTEFWMAYDHEFIYFAAKAYTHNPEKIVARQHIQGLNMDSDDQIHISIGPFHNQRDGYFFQVNPNGMRNDVLITNSNNGYQPEWSTIWYAESRINADGWSTEIKIPVKSLAFDPDNRRWEFNVGRVIRHKNEFLVWNSLGVGVWEMGPEAMASIEPIQDLETGKGVEILLSAKQARHKNYLDGKTESDFEPSVDIFYRPQPDILLATTINTDFSSTEVDDRVVNLTRFDVFLPEKRDFFLQDANRFSFGEISSNGLPFTSRRIGLDANGRALDISAGFKATGVTGDTGFGFLAVQQDAAFAQQHNANLMVARLTQNILPELTLGVMHTQGNPVADEKSSTSGVDLLYNLARNDGGTNFRSNFWYQQTDNENLIGDDFAYGLGFSLPNSRYDFIWNIVNIEKNFNPALGFVNRADIREQYLESRYKHYFDGGWFQSSNPDITWRRTTDLDDELLSENIKLQPLQLVFNQGDVLSAGIIEQREILQADFQLLPELTLLAGDYDFDRQFVYWKSAEARRLFTELEYQTGDFYYGKSDQRKITLGVRPIDRILLKVTYDENEITMPGQHLVARLISYKHEVAITDYWSWLLTLQYDNQSRLAYANSRIRWMPKPGSELYLVFNKGALRSEIDDEYHSVEDDAVIKFTYNLRF